MKKAALLVLSSALLAGCAGDAVEDSSAVEEKTQECNSAKEKIGVIYVVHGGFSTYSEQHLFDTSVQLFGYDPNSFVYRAAIWNPYFWPMILGVESAQKEAGKYAYEYERVGGTDPFEALTEKQLEQLSRNLKVRGRFQGVEYVTDWAAWMSADRIEHHPNPRGLFVPQVPGGAPLTYCAEEWEGCDPYRYNVDGPAERLLAQGVSKIVMVDMTTGGVRFFKTYDVIQETKKVVDAHNAENGTAVEVSWVNDPNNLMEDSYPTEPAGWTYSLGRATVDPDIPLEGNPNPVTDDPAMGALVGGAVLKGFSRRTLPRDTGVILLNHATRQYNEAFDPKIDDTLVLNQNTEDFLLRRARGLKAENVVGAYMGIKEENAENGLVERTREMRGENLGQAYLYQTESELPSGKWGYKYWEALEYLKSQGVKHIVIGFPQITTDSVLNLVEIPNQIAKEIGSAGWKGDPSAYPDVGHPFADYWGNWVDTDCGGIECCFEMGGCSDGRVYPPVRTTPIDVARGDMDPSLAYDVSAYGHLGYDASVGAPNENGPVQDQYTGTWAMYQPINTNPLLAVYLAKKVAQHVDELD